MTPRDDQLERVSCACLGGGKRQSSRTRVDQVTAQAQQGLCERVNVRFWHLADIRTMLAGLPPMGSVRA